jgi:hypothetical protein
VECRFIKKYGCKKETVWGSGENQQMERGQKETVIDVKYRSILYLYV